MQANRAQAFERRGDWSKALVDYEGEQAIAVVVVVVAVVVACCCCCCCCCCFYSEVVDADIVCCRILTLSHLVS